MLRSPDLDTTFVSMFNELATSKNQKICVCAYCDYNENGYRLTSKAFNLNDSMSEWVKGQGDFLLEDPESSHEFNSQFGPIDNRVLRLLLEESPKVIDFFVFYPVTENTIRDNWYVIENDVNHLSLIFKKSLTRLPNQPSFPHGVGHVSTVR